MVTVIEVRGDEFQNENCWYTPSSFRMRYGEAQRKLGSGGSEAIEEPGVGAAAGLPNCYMTAVGRGDGPAQILFGFLENRFGFAMQVHMQERLNAGW